MRTRPQTATVTRRDIVATVSLPGEVVAPTAHRRARAVSAPVAQVFASIGQRVRRGEALVELSHPSAQSGYEQTRAEVRAAEAALAREERRYRPAVETARRALAQARTAERAARAAATAGTTSTTGTTSPTPGAEASAPPPQVTRPEPGTVADEKPPVAPPAPDLAQAVAARAAAEQALREAQAAREAALLPLRRRLEAARVAFAQTERSRKTALVRAPISGTVLALNARPGQEVGPRGEDEAGGRAASPPLASVVDLEQLQVHAPIPADRAGAVKPGQPATLTFDELRGQQFGGRVRQITTDPTRSALKLRAGQRQVAIIGFENTQGLVKPDTRGARVTIRVAQERKALAVPAEAVDRDRAARPVVKVLRGGQWTAVVVEPGLSDGRFTAVRGDVREGETVLVTPELL